ncbi:hypothetical protein [Nesterenkonia xinjiangensis]|uniref:AAA domain-containing protein n=1 Tax=Nesterenkonia xinjiangensis TaxID=225327 RepID=A0A7Z0K9G5_9MICC|nr:hypothetical protein [Nesterenkonia xinjiangensis]NYJ78666.1 hypothetical protein [Nesterenkonia xinjiangensis]
MNEPRQPDGALILISAPPGTGKSTVLPHMISLARGRAVVADIDEVLEHGTLLGVKVADRSAAAIWPAYDRLWERITSFVTRSGFDMVLFAQVLDKHPAPGAGTVIGWEIDDDVRDIRLQNRQESKATIADARLDAIALRKLLPRSSIIYTSRAETPERCADALWRAVEPHLQSK